MSKRKKKWENKNKEQIRVSARSKPFSGQFSPPNIRHSSNPPSHENIASVQCPEIRWGGGGRTKMAFASVWFWLVHIFSKLFSHHRSVFYPFPEKKIGPIKKWKTFEQDLCCVEEVLRTCDGIASHMRSLIQNWSRCHFCNLPIKKTNEKASGFCSNKIIASNWWRDIMRSIDSVWVRELFVLVNNTSSQF